MESTQVNGGPLLEVIDLRASFLTRQGEVKAVDGVSFKLAKGEVLGLVGESGCGKSVSALSILRLIPSPPGKIVGGRILFDGRDLLQLSLRQMREIRGRQISMIFQEPMTSLNPVFNVGEQIGESLRLHLKLNRKAAAERAVELLKLVGIPSPATRLKEYPNQLSGGMRQRVMIAMALACDPRLLIADEPTTALDVTIQAQILELLARLREQLGMALMLITHDLGVIAETADYVAVMYAGKVVEYAAVKELFQNPLHPYTRGLMSCLPSGQTGEERGRLPDIPGSVPDLLRLPPGCSFQERCSLADERCRRETPPLQAERPEHQCACFRAGQKG